MFVWCYLFVLGGILVLFLFFLRNIMEEIMDSKIIFKIIIKEEI